MISKKTFTCGYCHKTFQTYIGPHNRGKFCSQECSLLYKKKKFVTKPCSSCNRLVTRGESEFSNKSRKSDRVFCNSSCFAIYNNSHKTKGTRVSKLELYIQKELTNLYPKYNFLFNDKTTIKSELDIYIPSLKLSFELNGIFHYEPIYGKGKLEQIQNNDNRKFQACLENDIELVIIDVSRFTYFKLDKANYFLGIIKNIIDKKSNVYIS